MHRMLFSAAALVALVACKPRPEPTPRFAEPGSAGQTAASPPAVAASEPAVPPPAPPAAQDPLPDAPPPASYAALPRKEVNRWAVRLDLPLYWIADSNRNKTIDPDEVASLLFYPTSSTPQSQWVESGKLTPAFARAYAAIVQAAKAGPPKDERQRLVGEDLDQGRPTLVLTDTSKLTEVDRTFIANMQKVGELVDALYELHNGSAHLASKLPGDRASHSLFRRNRGPRCVGPATENNPACSAIPGSPKVIFDIYPADLQATDKFCTTLEGRPDAKTLLQDHFAVVRGQGDQLRAVPYTAAYRPQMTAIAAALTKAADQMTDKGEAALVTYLRAAARAFETNDWIPADEAWAKMSVDNSRWYVRVAPDEVYWEPCSQKAGVHLTFARINEDSKRWQAKLVPVQQDMEQQIATLAGPPYAPRKVTFHLPDFIDIVLNAGDDRDPLGATIGQSLPNWGPVANEGRGRTVAMTNINTDVDSREARKEQAQSLLDAASMTHYATGTEPSLANTILHEAMHNLGPAHEYKVDGKTAPAIFTGPIASLLEELKAQTGALWLFEYLRSKQLVTDAFAKQCYADAVVWAMGHTSQGMYTGDGQRKTYSQVSAIQLGYLIEHGALVWSPSARAANGKDRGAFTLRYDKIVPVVNELMKLVAGIKARGDVAAARQLVDKYVDGKVVPHATITERFLRHAKPSFVYAIAP